MTVVKPVNHRLCHADLDYQLRPSCYWEPPPTVLDTILRNVRGSQRRAMITDYFHQGRLDELLSTLTTEELSEPARAGLGRIHPSLIGGEYLPGYRAGEVEIVRVELRSTTADAISLRARPVGRKDRRIEYRLVDEYETEFGLRSRRSRQPRTLGQLVQLLDSVEQSNADTAGC
jgi:hypothetical protein